MRLAAAALLLGLAGVAAGAPAPGSVRETLAGGVVVDWTAGRLLASGAAAADLRAPGPDVARVTAERAASERAREALGQAARKLPVAGGGTLGARAKADQVVAGRVETVLARAKVVEASYSSDGGARVMLSVPLEALWLAVEPATPVAADAAAPTAIIVDARKIKMKPALGLRVGSEKAAPPVVWSNDMDAAEHDPRNGARVEKVNASGIKGGVVEVKLDATWLAAGALVVIVIGGDK